MRRPLTQRLNGKVVTIYQDPITRLHPESEAKVRHVEIDDGGELLYCEVRFPDGDICGRWVDRGQLEG